MRRQAHPRIQLHAILPEHPARMQKTILWRELQRRDRLIRCRGLIPNHACILGWVVLGGGAELDLEVITRGVAVEVVEEPVGEGCGRVDFLSCGRRNIEGAVIDIIVFVQRFLSSGKVSYSI